MKTRYDERATVVILTIERYATGYDVAATPKVDVVGDVEIEVEEAGAVAFECILCDVGVGDESPAMIGASSDDPCIQDWVLPDELLRQTVEHIAEKAHLWSARDRAIMVAVHVELGVDGSDKIRAVEVGKDVGDDDCAVSLPSGPAVEATKAAKD